MMSQSLPSASMTNTSIDPTPCLRRKSASVTRGTSIVTDSRATVSGRSFAPIEANEEATRALAAPASTWRRQNAYTRKKEGESSSLMRQAGNRHASAAYIRKHGQAAYRDEIDADPTGIGFAFGGVDPGTLHAAGRLHRTHTVHYSVGRAGRYLMHVGLRLLCPATLSAPFPFQE